MDLLENVAKTKQIEYRIIAIDPNESRRDKMEKISKVVSTSGLVTVADIPHGKDIVAEWTYNIGCNAVLEVRDFAQSSHMQDLTASIDCW